MRIIYEHLGRAGVRHKLIQYNIKRTEASVCGTGGSGLDHLCCGEMALADYCLETGDTEAAGRVLTEVVQTAKVNGGYRLGFADCQSNNNVTLFYGLAGIGYELIRYTDKNRFPTIL
jgi:lantibiotic modifying enzyme